MEVAADNMASTISTVVVGLGVTGLSCARFLAARGLPFAVIDTREDAPGLDQLAQEIPEVPVYAGAYPQSLIEDAAEVVVSPGIAMTEDIVALARSAGVAVIGDIDLFMREARAPVVGITGSNAKSTVTEMLGAMAQRAGLNVGVGGNLGTPALELLSDERDLYVLELSSFQLERAGELGLAVATVLNVSEDHMDRHGTLPEYQGAKHRIFRGCSMAVVNPADPATVPLLGKSVRQFNWCAGEPQAGGFGLLGEQDEEFFCRDTQKLMPVSEMLLVGRHNVANALAALALGDAAGLPMQPMLDTLRTFSGLPHRCERVAQVGGVRYVNDSKGTNVGATEAALRGLGGDKDIVLIAGGQGKGADFSPLRESVASHCKQVILIGEDAPQLHAVLRDLLDVQQAATLREAVTLAAATAVPGDTVLLSPACASFDMFSGYEQRGEVFATAVHALPGGES